MTENPRPNLADLALLAIAAAGVLAPLVLPALKQSQAYHGFADTRSWLSVPNAGDVLSNFGFLPVGVAGLVWTLKRRNPEGQPDLSSKHPRMGWAVFFLGILLTAFGSAWYHWNPDNQRLMWDRLPMTLAFTSLLSLLVRELVHRRIGEAIFWPLVLAGIASVLYWRWSEEHGRENLLYYISIQYVSILLIVLIKIAYRSPAQGWGGAGVWRLTGFYALAKVLETFDAVIFEKLGWVSGHTLKHLAAAWGTWVLLRTLRKSG